MVGEAEGKDRSRVRVQPRDGRNINHAVRPIKTELLGMTTTVITSPGYGLFLVEKQLDPVAGWATILQGRRPDRSDKVKCDAPGHARLCPASEASKPREPDGEKRQVEPFPRRADLVEHRHGQPNHLRQCFISVP